MAKIHEYPIEQLTLENDDFFDVDHFDLNTSTFQSRKIKGSTIQQGIETSLIPLFDAKQNVLISGTNIKTINGQSILGFGNISITSSPSGNNGEIQFNDNGSFGANSNLFWDNLSNKFGVGTNVPQSRMEIVSFGGLATDLTFRVLNALGNKSFFEINGTGDIIPMGLNANNSNVVLGSVSARSLTGPANVSIGQEAMRFSVSSSRNVAIGRRALRSHVNSLDNVAIGQDSLFSLTNGNSNMVQGTNAMRELVDGSSNVSIGSGAGRFDSLSQINDVCLNSIFIGTNSSPLTNNEVNQIVIGFQANGNGSNTATIGNSNVTNFYVGTTLNLYQETTAISEATFVANSGGSISPTSTFDGYTIAQVVKALRNIGILA